MDVLSSQATIAGYAAVIEGARALDVLLPMLTTAVGGVKPAKMIAPRRGRRRVASDRHGPPDRRP
jgi:NAD/NADP transhydrogenase alpha subunit